jgi:hypothetical protein
MDWEYDNIFTSKQQTPILIYGFADGNKLSITLLDELTQMRHLAKVVRRSCLGSPIQLDNMYANEGMLMEN